MGFLLDSDASSSTIFKPFDPFFFYLIKTSLNPSISLTYFQPITYVFFSLAFLSSLVSTDFNFNNILSSVLKIPPFSFPVVYLPKFPTQYYLNSTIYYLFPKESVHCIINWKSLLYFNSLTYIQSFPTVCISFHLLVLSI